MQADRWEQRQFSRYGMYKVKYVKASAKIWAPCPGHACYLQNQRIHHYQIYKDNQLVRLSLSEF
jgi:hypothetical protein